VAVGLNGKRVLDEVGFNVRVIVDLEVGIKKAGVVGIKFDEFDVGTDSGFEQPEIDIVASIRISIQWNLIQLLREECGIC
jgi:hypothetical protein